MSAILALGATAGLLISGGAAELAAHRRRLAQIPVRIHVNGTRGKSSVARLIAAGLRFAGKRTCCKTTGTLPRMIMPDGSEYPVFRPSKANVIEQIRIVAAAVEAETEVLVLECMALIPQLQWLCEEKLVRRHPRRHHQRPRRPPRRHGAQRTRRRPALAGMIPPGGKLYTADREHVDFFAAACADRKCEFYPTSAADVAAITPLDIAGFSYVEHAENIALSLRVCAALGVDRATALQGMWKAKPDPGAMTVHEMNFFGREINFVNGFAANDPQSTELIWKLALERYAGVEKRIAIFNCRDDRPDRSRQLGEICVTWPPADHYLLIGSGTYIFAKYAVKAGLDPRKISIAENRRPEEIFEMIVELTGRSSLAMGMANIGGVGLDVVRYFANRSTNRIFK